MTISYHDQEWGVCLCTTTALFEFMSLDRMQAGLSRSTTIHKREAFQKAFGGFEIEIVATYDDRKIDGPIKNKGIVRIRPKVLTIVTNARCTLDIQKKYGSLELFL